MARESSSSYDTVNMIWMMSYDTEIHGWDQFFREVLSFLDTCDRQWGIANRQLTEYIIERLETCIRTIVYVKRVLQDGIDSATSIVLTVL